MPGLFDDKPDSTTDEEREIGSDEEREICSAQQQQADPKFQKMVDDLAGFFQIKGATGRDVQSELAHIVNDAMPSVIPDEKIKALIAEQMCRPANCTSLVVPTANPEILNPVNAKLKSKDLALQKTQSLVLKGAIANVTLLNKVMWSVVAERSSLPDSSSGVSSRMWVRIPAVTLVFLSKTLNHNCFSPPRG